ncbi:response regulator [Deinococcus deserti]|uniref:response regulator n=1 Tax=Deinococcus deserti TaxID=310783 RepID=UPI000673E06E
MEQAFLTLRGPESPWPDVVVLDMNPSGLDGLSLLAAIKSDPQLAHLPVVMLSDSGRPDIVQPYTLRATACIVKAPEKLMVVRQTMRWWTSGSCAG